MKTHFLFPLVLAAAVCVCLLVPGRSDAAVVMVSFTGINQAVPDGSPLGWSDTRTVSADFDFITSVAVSLEISGGFNGDLYAQLTHSSGFAVLLNRVGRTATNTSGYSDSGIDIEIDDSAVSAEDVHNYRVTLFGNNTVPLNNPLTGTWKSDGRAVDPGSVLDTSARTAMLGSFNGLDPDGTWTLFIADLDGGGQGVIQSWGLTITGAPEPGVSGLFALTAMLWLGFGRRRKPTA